MLPEARAENDEILTGRMPDKTFRIDFEKKKLEGTIDGLEALGQAVTAALMTKRYECPIFSHNYGTDYTNVMTGDYLKNAANLKTAVIDSLMTDERIETVEDFEFTRNGRSIRVKFTVKSIFGRSEYETEVM